MRMHERAGRHVRESESANVIRAGILGAAGFAGIQLAQILLEHPQMELVAAASDSLEGTPLSEAYPAFTGITDLCFCASAEVEQADADVVFLAVPHTASLEQTPRVVASGAVAIDLSADFRLRDAAVYEAWYGTAHTQQELLADAAFGLPELFSEDLVRAAQRREEGRACVVACAGCYPTATSLAAAPALRKGALRAGGIVVADAISGVTGAGKTPSARTHFCFANESVEAYGVTTHRHTPEIEQILGLSDQLVFTPHLAPFNRGLLSTVTIPLADDASISSAADAYQLYRAFYAESPFVEVLEAGHQPKTSSVVGTNRAQIGVALDERTRALVVTGAIDNLGKGAAGQAVQCANIVFGLDEVAGLSAAPLPV